MQIVNIKEEIKEVIKAEFKEDIKVVGNQLFLDSDSDINS